MSASAFLCEGIIRSPCSAAYWGPKWRTTSANSIFPFGGQTRGSTMAWPPSLEEAIGGLMKEVTELIPQRIGEVSVDFGGSQARVSEQDLDDADIDAALEHVRGKAVTQRVRSEIGAEATGVTRLGECGPRGCIGEMGRRSPAGKEPPLAAVGFPDLTEHLEDRFGQRENSFLISLADDVQNHLPGVDCGDGERHRLGNAQAIGVDKREAGPIKGHLERGDQAAAIGVTADVGQPLLARPADSFFVNSGQS